jgi:F-type H+-transporting ATPase subunit c
MMGLSLLPFLHSLAPIAAEVPAVGEKGLAAIGAGLVCIGSARGIGNIGGNAVEAIARQPEAGGRIQTSMIITAALIEGFTFFALVVCLLPVL